MVYVSERLKIIESISDEKLDFFKYLKADST